MKTFIKPVLAVLIIGLIITALFTGCSKDDDKSTPTGPNNGNYPPPSGGNPIGNWTFDHIDYQLINPLPDSIQFTMTGTGSGTLNLTATNFDLNQIQTTHLHTAYNYYGYWMPYDTSFTDTTHILGTYNIDGDTLVATVTESPTDPESIGEVQHMPYTATSSELIIYQDAINEYSPEFNMHIWTVYTK